jgi:hypothetical protein
MATCEVSIGAGFLRRLIILFFTLPWWAYIPLAGGVAYLGQEVYSHELRHEAARAVALDLGAPEPVDLSAFTANLHVGPAQEVNVFGWINTDYNYTLTKRRNGVKTSERYLFMVFGAADEATSRTVRAAIVFSERDRNHFVENLNSYVSAYRGDTPLFNFGGFARTSDAMGAMVSDAIAEQGLRKADDFFYLEPFLAGREAALSAQGAPEDLRKQIWAAALAIALLGIAKRVFGWGRKPDNATRAIDPRTAVQVQAPGGANKAHDYDYVFKAKARDVELSSDIRPDSPLGRLAHRSVTPVAAPEPEPDAEAEPARDPRAEAAIRRASEARSGFRKSVLRTVLGGGVISCAAVGVSLTLARGGNPDLATYVTVLPVTVLLVVLPVSVLIIALRFVKMKLALRGADIADLDETPVTPPTPRKTRPRAVLVVAALAAGIGYLNSRHAGVVSMPIRGYDPFAEPVVLYIVAGALLALTLLLRLRGGGVDSAQAAVRTREPAAAARGSGRLSGSRAWVKAAGRNGAASPTAINCDLRDRMKSDPFERFAEQARSLR